MPDEGWIKIHRKILQKGFWKNSGYAHLWVHILLRANSTPFEVLWNGKTVRLEPGQFITGRKALSIETGLTEGTIERALGLFEVEGQIEQQKTNKFRLIKVKNWRSYQTDRTTNGQQTDNKRTTGGHKQEEENSRMGEGVPMVPSVPSVPQGPSLSEQELIKSAREEKITPGDVAREFFGNTDRRMAYAQRIAEAKGADAQAVLREVEKFAAYWTEPSKSGRKLRWEMEKTFEVVRRLATWLGNVRSFASPEREKKGIRL